MNINTKKSLVKTLGALALTSALMAPGVFGASDLEVMDLTVTGNDIQFGGGGWGASAPMIDFNQGGSKIYDDIHLRIETDDNLYLSPGTAVYSKTMIPQVNNMYNLGESQTQWKDAYFSGTVNAADLTVTGTSTTLGTVTSGIWQGTAVANGYVADDLTISGGTIDNSAIGATTASSGAFTTLGVSGTAAFESNVDLSDSVNLRFGSSDDLYMRWDGTDFDVLSAAATSVTFGDGTNSIDVTVTGDATVSGGDLYVTGQASSSSTTEGTIYYDTDDDNLYVYANGAFVDMTAGAAGVNSLDDSYNDDTGERTIVGDAGAVSWDMSSTYDFVVDLQGTGDFVVQDAGTAAFTVTDGGTLTIANGATVTTGGLTVTAGGLTVTAGATTFGGAVNVGTSGTGHTVIFNSDTTGEELTWNDTSGSPNLALDGVNGTTVLNVSDGNAVFADTLDLNGVFDHDGSSFDVDVTGVVSLDADSASNFNTSSGDITIDAEASSVNVDGGEADAAAVRLNASNLAGGMDVDAGTAGITVDTTGAFSVDGAAASNLSVVTATNGEDLTIAVTGATDSSLFLNSAGTGADAIALNASAGGLTLDASGVLELNSSAGVINIGDDAIAQNINVGTGAAARTITVGNGTGATALALTTGTGGVAVTTQSTTADAIDINAQGTVTGTAINLETANGGIEIDADGSDNGDIIINAEDVMDIDSADTLSINSSAGVINIGNDGVAQSINVGTGAAARTITIGNVSGATALAFNAGTGGIALASTGAGDITLNSDDTMLLDADGILEINSDAGVIGIGSDADAQNINVGTGAAARTITIGNVSGATTLAFNSGTGNITSTTTDTGDIIVNSDDTLLLDADGILEINSSAGVIGIGSDDDAQNINVGTGSAARTITVGNGTGATALALTTGTGGVAVTTQSVTADAIDINAQGTVAGTAINLETANGGIEIDADGSGNGDIIINAEDVMDIDSADTLSINSSAGVINIGNDGVAQNINVGTGAAARTITIGNVTTTTGLALNAGTGHITLTSTGTGDIIVNSDDTMLLDADGILEINSTGVIGIGSDADAQNINIGTGGAARTVTIGNITTTTGLALNSGTNGVTVISTGAGDIDLEAADNLYLAGAGEVYIGDSTSAVGDMRYDQANERWEKYVTAVEGAIAQYDAVTYLDGTDTVDYDIDAIAELVEQSEVDDSAAFAGIAVANIADDASGWIVVHGPIGVAADGPVDGDVDATDGAAFSTDGSAGGIHSAATAAEAAAVGGYFVNESDTGDDWIVFVKAM